MGKRKNDNLLGKPGPGRPKGMKNKLPSDLKNKVLQITEDLEAQGKGLSQCASENPKWFFENFVKVLLPKHVESKTEHDLTEAMRKECFNLFRGWKKGK